MKKIHSVSFRVNVLILLLGIIIGGGLVTSLWPTFINKFGATVWGLIACGISLAIFLVIFFLFRVKNFKMQQRN